MAERKLWSEEFMRGVGDGTNRPDPPLDRSQGWDDPVFETIYVPERYPKKTEKSVRYLPITRGSRLLGFLWASIDDQAADFMELPDEDGDSFNAGVPWTRRLRIAKEEGLTPLEALRRWVGAPEDPRAGTIVADAEEREAPGLQALRELADRAGSG